MIEIPGFDDEEVTKVTIDVIEKILEDEKVFKYEKLKDWTDTIVRETLKELAELNQPFKYILMCDIIQRYGAEIYSFSSCFFNPTTDAVKTIKWENDAMFCTVTLYALGVE